MNPVPGEPQHHRDVFSHWPIASMGCGPAMEPIDKFEIFAGIVTVRWPDFVPSGSRYFVLLEQKNPSVATCLIEECQRLNSTTESRKHARVYLATRFFHSSPFQQRAGFKDYYINS